MSIILILSILAYLSKGIINPLIFVGLGLILFFVDTWLFTRGYDGWFWSHRTPNEIEAQKRKLGL